MKKLELKTLFVSTITLALRRKFLRFIQIEIFIFILPPLRLVQYQNDKRPMSQPEALFDEGFHGNSSSG